MCWTFTQQFKRGLILYFMYLLYTYGYLYKNTQIF